MRWAPGADRESFNLISSRSDSPPHLQAVGHVWKASRPSASSRCSTDADTPSARRAAPGIYRKSSHAPASDPHHPHLHVVGHALQPAEVNRLGAAVHAAGAPGPVGMKGGGGQAGEQDAPALAARVWE